MNDEGFTITSKGVQNGVNEGPLATLPNEQRAKPMEKVFDSNDVSYDNGDVDDTDEGRTSQNNDAKRQPEFGLDRCQRVKMEYRGICIRSVLAEAAMEVGEAAVDIMKQDALNQVHRIQKRLDDENALLILSKK
ncbi:uncharacterized protein LOC113505647 [Trichoplusia ni]|uniref:Uncharacterized protein LOC113505647 n=1 Tax=Trichoplusia ni TaxID=7111 RepID=A0A7E5WVD8_TRINI|nr:uncharacterized protein LOC113505647 [Trichoplusia ni]